MVKKIIANMKKKVINIHFISRQAPIDPKNDIKATIKPVTINMDVDAIYDLVPNNLSINDLSASVHTPIEKTTKPPTFVRVKREEKLVNN